jgi:HD superfamily phosphodiesterase
MIISCSETNENKKHKELLLKILKKCKEDDIIGISYEDIEDRKRNYANLKISINKKIFDLTLKKILG